MTHAQLRRYEALLFGWKPPDLITATMTLDDRNDRVFIRLECQGLIRHVFVAENVLSWILHNTLNDVCMAMLACVDRHPTMMDLAWVKFEAAVERAGGKSC